MESVGVYYSHNMFCFRMRSYHQGGYSFTVEDLGSLKKWANTWGELAAPHIHWLGFQCFCRHCSKKVLLDFRDANVEVRTVRLRKRTGQSCALEGQFERSNLCAFVQTVLQKPVDPKVKAYHIIFLVTALSGAMDKFVPLGFANLSAETRNTEVAAFQEQFIERGGMWYGSTVNAFTSSSFRLIKYTGSPIGWPSDEKQRKGIADSPCKVLIDC